MIKRLILALIVVLLSANISLANDSDIEFFEKTKIYAEQGDALSQNNLGSMYENGQGVPKDDVKAFEWYRKAAEQGYANAQYILGLMYAKGQLVPKDDVKAYAWISITYSQGLEKSKEIFQTITKKLTPDQLAKGQKLASEYWEKYVLPFRKD